MKTTHIITVGNIGTVYDGVDEAEAQRKFDVYVAQSKNAYGRASGESVVWIKDEDIYKEHEGTVQS